MPQNWYGISRSYGHVTSSEIIDIGLVRTLDFAAIAGIKLLQNLSVAPLSLGVSVHVFLVKSLIRCVFALFR